MSTKMISSTAAQNNFGRVLDDVVQNGARYVIRRRNLSHAILLSLTDFNRLLAAREEERHQLSGMIRELSPIYNLGDVIDE